VVSGALVFQSVVLGVLLGGLYALLASGLTLYFGVMRVVMIAHSAFLILAGYLAWYFHRQTGLDPLLSLPITGRSAGSSCRTAAPASSCSARGSRWSS